MMRATPSCPSSTGMAATLPRPAFTKHEKRRRDPFASASAIAGRRGGERVRARGPEARDPRGQRGDLVRRHERRERLRKRGRLFPRDDRRTRRRPRPRAARLRRPTHRWRVPRARAARTPAPAAPIRSRATPAGEARSCRARDELALRGAGADDRRGALDRRELAEQRQSAFAAVLPLAVRRIGNDDRRRARRRGDRARGRDARAESFDRPRLA